MKCFSDFDIKPIERSFDGDRIKIFKILNKQISVLDYRIVASKFIENGEKKRLDIQIEVDGQKHIIFTGSVNLMKVIEQINKSELPFTTIIEKDGESFKFT